MEEDEEDRVLFSSLGVTSANPEDIERNIFGQTENGFDASNEAARSMELEATEHNATSSTKKTDMYNKLRAVETEIQAVKSGFEQLENFRRNDEQVPDREDGHEKRDIETEQSTTQAPLNDLDLQRALAADRLKSLLKTKAQLKKEISDLSNDSTHDTLSVLRDIVKEQPNAVLRDVVKGQPKPKRRLKEAKSPSKNKKKRIKTASLDDDDDFDAVLNAASSGFVETEKDQLVRKGILTPFHKLKGFERQIQEPGQSSRHSMQDNGDLVSTSLANAIQSISEAAQSRPTTKLLDSSLLPKLEPPTYPFQTPRKHVKISQSAENGRNDKRKRRPTPGKKWRVKVSRENKDEGPDVEISSYEDEKDDEDMDDEGPPFVMLEGGLKIPETIFDKLFDYQKVGVQWLWELHCQKAGGIIGDEMGLGKTVQVLAFLGSLHFSNAYKPSIIVCPLTLLQQWKREAKKWYPSFHVEILHDSVNDFHDKKKGSKSHESDSESEELLDVDVEKNLSFRNTKKWDKLINHVLGSDSGLLITTYEQLRLLGEKLLDIEWGYAVLDEGHRIRNPNTDVTLVCKQLQTVHRIIMTGSPIQNKLSELWSLFDFVFPGKLGVLPVFEAEFAVPISIGGYANATPLQVSTAYRCAVVLRDLIMPYLLRRMKADVNAQLPKKTEHVIFCSLTSVQRSIYQAFLASTDVEQIFDGSKNALYGIDVMRKICNHPDLLEREHSCRDPDYGNPERSGKMKVVAEVLKLWKDQGHRVLFFSQTQQMLDILENFLVTGGYKYRRMDGATPVKQRMALIDEFNNTVEIFIFILTTRVGGLGTNLTGANRVIIFDPDWNPSNDMQARERAWRIGQKKDVTVYRLITRGTIEEKVYHRQIYKHSLTNKILKNPQQRRLFKARDLKDLFVLNDDGENGSTESSSIFSQLSEDVNITGPQHPDQEKDKSIKTNPADHGTAMERDNNSGSNGEEKADNNNGDVDEDTSILRTLFDAHGIHSAMDHDAIVNAHDEEKLKLEEQASRVAQRAAEALRQSRMLRSQESVAIPTWTGRSGTAGAPPSIKKKFGSTLNPQLVTSSKPLEESSMISSRRNGIAAGASAGKALSSAELLAKIRGNQERAISDGLEHQHQFNSGSSSNSRTRAAENGASRPSHGSAGMQPEVLIRQVCTFIQRKGGSTSSASIVEHFRSRVPSKDLALFKNLLKEIATLKKNPNGSFWILKPEYQEE
ncbi:PREDICTED: protein CHROMATIN REMODELING 8 [Ipomoea nil]|uniref:protein CHROMATIN REMODELING 8 n=1 Tax=Ipomoea nil TaxID=35883 RepID=UPI0009011A18|nr:PREDICTED: protein CHROMATIN REMODELING 8 [Ipomoea nil]XP_019188436.1 PREDICTED: protein CHROMATIN REMODELING 8 [Ipomoea nil]XP_019188437.1 PREDICTED: protein CHROMATIN REMODELING 8 [Ipomoea nil]